MRSLIKRSTWIQFLNMDNLSWFAWGIRLVVVMVNTRFNWVVLLVSSFCLIYLVRPSQNLIKRRISLFAKPNLS